MKTIKKIKCDKKLKEQCTSQYGSYACRLRYFNERCLMALKNKEKEGKQR